MDLSQFTKPIVVPKPVKGREMQTTALPKDMIGTVKVVSTKAVTDDAMESIQKPRGGDIGVYHEGYVDGKLYLVPDSTLEAMKDIVNLKMRRRYSSRVKPQTSLDEPTQYNEFTAKLDNLLEKIDILAESSDDTTSKEPEYMEIGKERKKASQSITSEKKIISSDKIEITSVSKDISAPEDLFEEKDITQPTKNASESNDKFIETQTAIPPILDKNIKYKRVKAKYSSKTENEQKMTDFRMPVAHEVEFEKKMKIKREKTTPTTDYPLLADKEYCKTKSLIDNDYRPFTDSMTEKFTLLVSGHLKHGKTPMFIIHKNSPSSNVLENQTPDFISHKQQGNIDIFISGKFFTENILIDESEDSPAILNVKPHKIIINEHSIIYQNKFKNVYNIGPIEIALEGEFIIDNDNLKYTPVLSLEILKHTPLKEFSTGNLIANKDHQLPTTVLYDEKENTIPTEDTNYDSEQMKNDIVDSDAKIESQTKGIFEKIKDNIIYKQLFLRNKEKLKPDAMSNVRLRTSSQRVKSQLSRNRKEIKLLRRKSIIEGRKNKKRRRQKEIKNKSVTGLNTAVEIYRGKEETKSPFTQRKDSDGEKAVITTQRKKGTKQNFTSKKRKKGNKNNAIVENPILAQMQEFFVQ